MVVWTIEVALGLIRALQPECRAYGYHLALGGGVLNKGESEKDLDLYFLPMNPFNADETDASSDPEGLIAYLEKLWGPSTPITGDYGDKTCYKKAVKFIRGKVERIDVFVF